MNDTTPRHSSEIIVDQPVLDPAKRPDPPAGWTRPKVRADYSDQPWIPHGTMRGYNQNCSCDACRRANRRSQLWYVLRKRERDGLPPVEAKRPAAQGPRTSTRLRELAYELVRAYTPDLFLTIVEESDPDEDIETTIVELLQEHALDVYRALQEDVDWERAYMPRALPVELLGQDDTPAVPLWPDAGRLLGMTHEQTLVAVKRREFPIVLIDGELAVLVPELRRALVKFHVTPVVEQQPEHEQLALSTHEHVDTLTGVDPDLGDDADEIAVPLWPDAGRAIGWSKSHTYRQAQTGGVLVIEVNGKRMVTLAEIERRKAAS